MVTDRMAYEDRDMEGRPCEGEGRDWNYVALSQAKNRHQKQEREGRRL